MNKIIMLLSIMGMSTTSTFAGTSLPTHATEIFKSGINVGITQKLANINKVKCEENGISVDCVIKDIVRKPAPYSTIDANWPDFTTVTNSINVPSGDTEIIEPGNYNSINVEPGGVLIMNPGVYWIDQYRVKGQVLSSDVNVTQPEVTISLLVKSRLDLAGSYNNCKIDGTPDKHPNRYVLYTEDIAPDVDNAAISGYVYFKNTLIIGQHMDLWGAISAESITLNNGANMSVFVDLDHLIFTNFDSFLEVGPNMTAGWHMVRAPAEINATNSVTVADFFGDDLNTSTFNTEWVVYQRDYNTSTHKRYYTPLDDLNMTLEKNRGYWLGTTKDAELKVLGLNPVVWDRKMKTKEGCTTPQKGCYRYALQTCTEGDTDTNLYNLIGSVGSTDTYWGDYRIEVKDKLTGAVSVMHPDDAFKNNIMSNQIWKYNVVSNGYDIIGTSLLSPAIEYFDGFWVEMNCTDNTIEKEINLIIPNGKAN